MSLHHSQRDASGRVISLIHETNEMPSVNTRHYYTSAPSPYSAYSYGGHKRDASNPGTPDLARSDSYDSQSSGHDSPLTPNSSYEPLFTNLKDASAHQTVLPPISSLHKVAGIMEAGAAPAPELGLRKNSYYGSVTGATPSSSSLDDFHYRSSMDSHRSPISPLTESTTSQIQHSVEIESPYSDLPLLNRRQSTSQESRHEKSDASSKKGIKTKNGSQKRYPCKDPSCDKSFTTSGHASRHAKIHEGLKPISCTFEGCPKRFTRQDNMKQHLETHRREKSRASAKAARRPSLASRRQSASSKGSFSRFSSPRDTPPLLSPSLQSVSMLSPTLRISSLSEESWPRPSIASRTPSGLDALAIVAATEQATVEHEEAQRQAEDFHHWRPSQY
ncbi:hypothetical protein BD289DRAFT_214415 [Coniella lustricola]|uniref:C2H2-type domain-containing protein n=1 Tax=Coniella lustricola TaxID=2025994 RepID=A0A2T3ABE0_9PEZI|nr:hypothetical protein BD289DRAFT_214415 [Coniella lustricola]